MNIFTSQKEMKKWAVAMANACGGQEVSQTSIKLNKTNPKKVQDLTTKFITDYNEMMETAMALDDIELADSAKEVAEVDEIQSDIKEELYSKKEEE